MQQLLALTSWQQQRNLYLKSICQVISTISKPTPKLFSADYQQKEAELISILQGDQFLTDREEQFLQIFVHQINDQKNISLMELVNRLKDKFGGAIRFWQNQVNDTARSVTYHNQLTIWETYSCYDKYLGCIPQKLQQIRKTRAIAKPYLAALSLMIKLIQKAKIEDLFKLDDHFVKLKKVQEKYYAYIQQTTNNSTFKQVSLKGKNNAKMSLFYFFKPKESKNSLYNYKFTDGKEDKILKDQKLNQYQAILSKLQNDQMPSTPICQLRNLYKYSRERKQQKPHDTVYTTIYDKCHFFNYNRYPISTVEKIDYTCPYELLKGVNYELDEIDYYDELLAEDLSKIQESDDYSTQSSESVGSFVVSDGYDSSNEQKTAKVFAPKLKAWGVENWVLQKEKDQDKMKSYEMFCVEECYLPMKVNHQPIFDQQLLKKLLNSQPKCLFTSIIQDNKINISKNKLDMFVKNNFSKVRINKKIVYQLNDGKMSKNDLSQDQSRRLSKTQSEIEQTNKCKNAIEQTKEYDLNE